MTHWPESNVVRVDPDIADLIPRYLDNRRQDIGDLRAAVTARDLATIRSIAHQLRGSGGGYGLDAISDFGNKLGEAARAADLASVSVWIDELERYVTQVEVVPWDSPS